MCILGGGKCSAGVSADLMIEQRVEAGGSCDDKFTVCGDDTNFLCKLPYAVREIAPERKGCNFWARTKNQMGCKFSVLN